MRGLKHDYEKVEFIGHGRTFTGAWIETRNQWSIIISGDVAPSRVRGLKLSLSIDYLQNRGRTFTGAWIETFTRC